jgi:putative transcriptional regulator
MRAREAYQHERTSHSSFGPHSLRLAQRFVCCLLLACLSLTAEELAAGKFLVASRDLGDPNFQETVVLLTRYGEKGAMGLIVNRPTQIAVKRFLPTLKFTESVYFGGPVELNGVMGLQPTESHTAEKILSGVYLLIGSAAIEKAVTTPGSKGLRIFAGYSGWSPGQLEREMKLGGWHVFAGDAQIVFSARPESVWQKLIRRTELVIARVTGL